MGLDKSSGAVLSVNIELHLMHKLCLRGLGLECFVQCLVDVFLL